jgi:hypothetical protein
MVFHETEAIIIVYLKANLIRIGSFFPVKQIMQSILYSLTHKVLKGRFCPRKSYDFYYLN